MVFNFSKIDANRFFSCSNMKLHIGKFCRQLNFRRCRHLRVWVEWNLNDIFQQQTNPIRKYPKYAAACIQWLEAVYFGLSWRKQNAIFDLIAYLFIRYSIEFHSSLCISFVFQVIDLALQSSESISLPMHSIGAISRIYFGV